MVRSKLDDLGRIIGWIECICSAGYVILGVLKNSVRRCRGASSARCSGICQRGLGGSVMFRASSQLWRFIRERS